MSSIPRTTKISDTTWEVHKDDILKLYLDDRRWLKDIVSIMKTEHGFEATISQYEAQFRVWKVRRNLKVSEWHRIFSILDSLDPGTVSRVTVSDRVVHEKTIRRARRNCKSKSMGSEGNSQMDYLFDNEISDFSIEIQNQDGTWYQFPGGATVGPIPMPTDEPREIVESRITEFRDTLLNSLPLLKPTRGPLNLNDFVDFPEFLWNHPSPLKWRPATPTMATPTLEEFTFSIWDNLSESLQSEHPLRAPYEWLKILSLGKTSSLLASWKKQLPMIHNEIVRPLMDMEANMDVSVSKHWESSHSNHNLQNLQALIPGSLLPKQWENEVFVTSPSGTFNDESLFEGLIFVIANKLSGLGNIPMGPILKLFAHSEKATTPFPEAGYDHFTRALAESLFEAAIEEKENNVLRIIQRTGLVSANKVISTKNGHRCRAIKRVAELKNLAAMKILLNTKENLTEANREDLIKIYSDKQKTLDAEWVEFCVLIRDYWPDAISETSQDCENPRNWTIDAIRLALTSFTPLDHKTMVKFGIIRSIVKTMEDNEVVDALRLIHDNCKKTECGCFCDNHKGLGAALFIGVNNGHYELAKFLLPFCGDKYLLAALSISIKSQKSDLVTLLVENIEEDSYENVDECEYENVNPFGKERHENGTLLPPIAEALLLNDTALVNRLEMAGALSFSCIGNIMAAALEIRNIDYIKRLLDQFSHIEPGSLATPLFLAIENGFDDIALILLDEGADVNYHIEIKINGKKYIGLPLNAAIERGNFQLVNAILSAGIGPSGVDITTFQALCEPGSMSMFNEHLKYSILDMFSELSVRNSDNKGLLDFLFDLYEVGQYDTLKALLSSLNCDDTKQIDSCFEGTIKAGNTGLVQLMLSYMHGAIELSVSYLALATYMGHTAILRLLLRQVQNNVTPGSIPFPLRMAIKYHNGYQNYHSRYENYHFNFECLDILFASKIFDFKVYNNVGITPLYTAIDIINDHPDAAFFIINKLLEDGCNPNAISTRTTIDEAQISETALLQAIGKKNETLVELLVQWGANVHGTAYITVRRTPLQKAAEVGDLAIVKFLLEHEVDVNAPPLTRSGGTALQFAAISGNCNVAAELLSHGALLHTPPPSKINGRWPIEGAAEHGRLHMIEYLWIAKENIFIPKGCETGFEEKYCRRAMKLAERNGHIACRNLIAEKAGLSIDDI